MNEKMNETAIDIVWMNQLEDIEGTGSGDRQNVEEYVVHNIPERCRECGETTEYVLWGVCGNCTYTRRCHVPIVPFRKGNDGSVWEFTETQLLVVLSALPEGVPDYTELLDALTKFEKYPQHPSGDGRQLRGVTISLQAIAVAWKSIDARLDSDEYSDGPVFEKAMKRAKGTLSIYTSVRGKPSPADIHARMGLDDPSEPYLRL